MTPANRPYAALDGAIDAADDDLTVFASSSAPARGLVWRRRLLLTLALLAMLGVVVLARGVGASPQVRTEWHVDSHGQVVLTAARDPRLRAAVNLPLVAIIDAGALPEDRRIDVDRNLLLRSDRWIVSDSERASFRERHARIDSAVAAGRIDFEFADGTVISAQSGSKGVLGLGAQFWICACLGFALVIVALVVALARPTQRNVLYAVMSLCQAGNLMCEAVASSYDLSLPTLLRYSGEVRMMLDVLTSAAVVQSVSIAPRRLAGSSWITGAVWSVAAVIGVGVFSQTLPAAWWWVQSTCAGFGLIVVGLLSWSNQGQPHPLAILIRRFVIAAVIAWALLSLAVVSATPVSANAVIGLGSALWSSFFATLLLVIPFLARSQQVVREFAMLAATTVVATSLDLMFVTVFSIGQFASLTLALFLSLGVYAALRQWIVNQMVGNSMVTAERMFEQLYRVARAVEQQPSETPALLSGLLRDLFDPLESTLIDHIGTSTRVIDDGSALIVPVPDLDRDATDIPEPRALLIRFAQRGRRLFTLEDARLADRVVEQLRRAVAFDQAVEQGRSEERTRIAQDLHDDIGARLLTLMYKAPSPEMEDYVRHTLQDLKTLTRGLAAPSHRLSDSVGEWKADIAQRLSVVHCELGWAASFEHDMPLSVVQWSALTRVLRELVSNTIAHAQATRVDIDLNFENDRLDLTVADNGIGREPSAWSHGLGLGGVRKRVKQLGGEVDWRENLEAGITCTVRIRDWSKPR